MHILGVIGFSANNNFSAINYQKKSYCNFGKFYNGDIYLSMSELRQQAHDKRVAEENKILEKGQKNNATIQEKADALKILKKREEEKLRGLDYPENIIQENLEPFNKQIRDLLNKNAKKPN